jgi:hypothetical protein
MARAAVASWNQHMTFFPRVTRSAQAQHLIELNLHEASQLFNSMDPSPFQERDLDQDADEYIVSWAREYAIDAPVRLRVHLERWPASDPTPLITDAIHHYYQYRAEITHLEFKRILREGRLALIIGLVCLGTCLLAAHALIPRNAGDWGGYVRESLTIAGWVSMWRPMEMYLYDWWPVLRRERVFRKLAAMPVEVVGAPPVAKVANHLLVKA